MKDRLKALRKELGLTQEKFAKGKQRKKEKQKGHHKALV